MLALDIQHEGRNLSLELPMPKELLADELRNFGYPKTLGQIERTEIGLYPTSDLGEHFMKLVQPDDTLQHVALYANELNVLDGASRQAFVDLLMADRFGDLDQLGDYLQYGRLPVREISLGELAQMTDREGLILQGCGGELKDWVDGINEMFTEEGILLEGDKCKDITVFEQDGCTNLLFGMNDVKLDVGKLAMWRLQTQQQFGGMWLSDYLPNRLGVDPDAPRQEVPRKPDCPLVGADGNIFSLIGIASRTLKQNGLADQAKEMFDRAFASGSYDGALGVIMDYVNVTTVDDELDEDFDDEPEEDDDFDEDEGFGPTMHM